ncbi:MAG: type II toxin-antitoxin system RelB/DinJ family antitoxin [Oscillospiraceae bacterium]|nr:type II toxin-antitoxin system RelB/DinJ family antitoxin [Oscillospiraceae bacterium]
MNQSTSISLRMDRTLKRQAEDLFADLGLNMTTAMTLFLRQAVMSQSIPFAIARVPNAETLEAMREAEDIIRHPEKYKSYRSVDEMMEDILADEEV